MLRFATSSVEAKFVLSLPFIEKEITNFLWSCKFSIKFVLKYTLWVQIWQHWIREKAIELIDPSLSNNSPIDQLLKCIHIGLLCVQENPADRPLMSAVNFMLTSNTVQLPSLSRPGFCTLQEICVDSTEVSKNELSITELEPRWLLTAKT